MDTISSSCVFGEGRNWGRNPLSLLEMWRHRRNAAGTFLAGKLLQIIIISLHCFPHCIFFWQKLLSSVGTVPNNLFVCTFSFSVCVCVCVCGSVVGCVAAGISCAINDWRGSRMLEHGPSTATCWPPGRTTLYGSPGVASRKPAGAGSPSTSTSCNGSFAKKKTAAALEEPFA